MIVGHGNWHRRIGFFDRKRSYTTWGLAKRPLKNWRLPVSKGADRSNTWQAKERFFRAMEQEFVNWPFRIWKLEQWTRAPPAEVRHLHFQESIYQNIRLVCRQPVSFGGKSWKLVHIDQPRLWYIWELIRQNIQQMGAISWRNAYGQWSLLLWSWGCCWWWRFRLRSDVYGFCVSNIDELLNSSAGLSKENLILGSFWARSCSLAKEYDITLQWQWLEWTGRF